MADLTNADKRKLEKLFEMSGGYVLNFSNRTFDEFVFDSTGIVIDDAKYQQGSGSKANRLRAFWSLEPDHVVGSSSLIWSTTDRATTSPPPTETLSTTVAALRSACWQGHR